MGRGFPVTNSTKQKLNTRSSTETELVSVDDCMPSVLWTRHFLEAQGCDVKENIVCQDNKSAILMEVNGKASSSKRTKHINIRHYFATDRINKKELSMEWCPTADMTGDHMTKPVQGKPFRQFRDEIMGVVAPRKPGKGKSKKEDGVVRTSAERTSSTKEKNTKNKCLAQCKQGMRARHHRSVLEKELPRKGKLRRVQGRTVKPV